MNTVRNKWNGNFYEVLEQTGKEVTLKRIKDGYTFTIAVSEFYFSYSSKRT